MTTIIAIDPGKAGGLAWVTNGAVITSPAPATESDLVEMIRGIQYASNLEGNRTVAYVEKVSGFAGKNQPGSRMFNFGWGCGVIEGALRALKIETIYVRPQEWQKHFSLGTASACATKTVWKNKLKAEAQRRYPNQKVTLNTADALLILSYATS